jgi:Protein phosphatase 2C
MWQAVGHSVKGIAHEASGTPCQDYVDYFHARLGVEQALLVGIADGAGSAAAAKLGAEASVQHLLRSVAALGKRVIDLTEDDVRMCFRSARDHLEELAERDGIPLRELSCTALLGVLGETGCVFAQIGDGAWVAEYRGACEAITWPAHGEHANETIFLTHPSLMSPDGWERHFQFKRWEKPVMNIAGFTDGLEGLALHLTTRTAHGPFFSQMFTGLSNALAQHNDLQDFAAPLIAFLQSDEINQRTEDDKTLVVACRRRLPLCDAPPE